MLNARLTLFTGDRGDRGIKPGTRRCSSGITSSLGEPGSSVYTSGGYRGIMGGSAPDRLIGETALAGTLLSSSSSTGDPGMGGMSEWMPTLSDRQRGGGGGRSPGCGEPYMERVALDAVEETEEAVLSRVERLRLGGGTRGVVLRGASGGLTRSLRRMGASGGGGNRGCCARLLVPSDGPPGMMLAPAHPYCGSLVGERDEVRRTRCQRARQTREEKERRTQRAMERAQTALIS
jgi:hypothetical protein